MRALAVALLFVGLVAIVIGSFSGCGALFGWNGRHAVDTVSLVEGHTERTLTPSPGRRYTVSVQVVFDRTRVETRDGAAVVEAKFPLVVRVTDARGGTVADVRGWLDPTEPPSVLYGQSVSDALAARTELLVERLVGPFMTSSEAPLSVSVDLGADVRAGGGSGAPVLERRLIVYDDALPPRIRNAFVLAAFGVLAFVAGAILGVVGWFRTRRGGGRNRRKRGGIPEPDVL